MTQKQTVLCVAGAVLLAFIAGWTISVKYSRIRAYDVKQTVLKEEKYLQGVYMQAWVVVYNDFKEIKRLPKEAKVLSRYKIVFEETESSYKISFSPILPDKYIPTHVGGDVMFEGKIYATSLVYHVDKKEMKITNRYGFA